MRRPPRYDLPNAAPAPLELVRLFVNTSEHEHDLELLGTPGDLRAWFARHADDPGRLGPAAVRRAHRVRSALRTLIRDGRVEPELAEAARRARLSADLGGPALVPQSGGIDGALGSLIAIVYDARRDGTWDRLKACRNCGWAFWDESRNRSAQWCSMQLCGNRLKVRRYRSRRATPRSSR